jgi:hypothetical protein
MKSCSRSRILSIYEFKALPLIERREVFLFKRKERKSYNCLEKYGDNVRAIKFGESVWSYVGILNNTGDI